MPKFIIPTEDTFAKKISIAIGLLLSVVFIGTMLLYEGDYNLSFLKTIELITHVSTDGNTILSIGLSLIGYVTQFYILYVILEFVLEGKLKNLFSEVKTLKSISKMKNHYIICGGGRVGQNVANELIEQKKQYVILEADDMKFKKLKTNHYTVLNEDALEDNSLIKTHILDASWLIACLGDDGDNILLVLSAKEQNPNIRIAARANHERIVQKLRHAGADHVVLPEMLGGKELAQATIDKIAPPLEHSEPEIDLKT